MTWFNSRARAGRVAAAICLAIAIAAPFLLSPVDVYKLSSVLVWAMAAVGLNLITGYTRLISLAQGTMVAVGAYTSAILMSEYSWPFWATIPAAAALSFGLGIVIGVPALRLRGMYLALLTLAIAVSAPPLIKHFESITNGTRGISLPRQQAPSWLPLADDQFTFFVSAALAVVVFVLGRNLMRSNQGLAIRTIGARESIARPMGIDVPRTKVLVFAWGSGFGGVAGAAYANVVGYVQPDSFSVMLGATLLLAVVIGGARTAVGPLLGGLFVVYVPELAGGVDQEFAGVLYGLAVVVVLLLAPGGVAGFVARHLRRRRSAKPNPTLQNTAATSDESSKEKV